MVGHDLEQSLGQNPPHQRSRRISLGGVGIDPGDGVAKFPGEGGVPSAHIELSGEELREYEAKEVELRQKLVDSYVELGYTPEEARRLMGLD